MEDNFSMDGRMGWGDGSGSNASNGEQQLKLYSISSKGSGSGTPRCGDSCVIFQGERVTRGPKAKRTAWTEHQPQRPLQCRANLTGPN